MPLYQRVKQLILSILAYNVQCLKTGLIGNKRERIYGTFLVLGISNDVKVGERQTDYQITFNRFPVLIFFLLNNLIVLFVKHAFLIITADEHIYLKRIQIFCLL